MQLRNNHIVSMLILYRRGTPRNLHPHILPVPNAALDDENFSLLPWLQLWAEFAQELSKEINTTPKEPRI